MKDVTHSIPPYAVNFKTPAVLQLQRAAGACQLYPECLRASRFVVDANYFALDFDKMHRFFIFAGATNHAPIASLGLTCVFLQRSPPGSYSICPFCAFNDSRRPNLTVYLLVCTSRSVCRPTRSRLRTAFWF